MTGRMFVQPASEPLPKHAAVSFNLGKQRFVYEDTRYFGRLTLEVSPLAELGPEPLGDDFTVAAFALALKRFSQAIKVKLLDQRLVAGIGNIYASEALFRAGISPRRSARRLKSAEVKRLWEAVREVLAEAIACGSTIPLDFPGQGKGDGVFYFGRAEGATDYYMERLRVYDRAGQPCVNCGQPIRRLVQAARGAPFLPRLPAVARLIQITVARDVKRIRLT